MFRGGSHLGAYSQSAETLAGAKDCQPGSEAFSWRERSSPDIRSDRGGEEREGSETTPSSFRQPHCRPGGQGEGGEGLLCQTCGETETPEV